MSNIYWRVYQANPDVSAVPVYMQWFDEPDYGQTCFLTDEQFETEQAAQAWINRRNIAARLGMSAESLQVFLGWRLPLYDSVLGRAMR